MSKSIREIFGAHLGWTAQLELAKLRVTEPEKFAALVRELNGERQWDAEDLELVEIMSFLESEGARRPPPVEDIPVQFTNKHWAVYDCHVTRLAARLLEELRGIYLRWIVNVRIANLPMMVLDEEIALAFNALRFNYSGYKLLSLAMRTRAYADLIAREHITEDNVYGMIAKSAEHFPCDALEINDYYPLMLTDRGERVLEGIDYPMAQPVSWGGFVFYPVLPYEVHRWDTDFWVEHWGFLI